jgi:2-polyprenyl-3-methyl-5-hydroxy-6-metoxy-1,4-benzoquinol methylase
MTDPILKANLEHYGDGKEVETYLFEKGHHKDRVDLTLSLIEKELAKINQRKTPKGIELASGNGDIALKIRAMGADITACDAAEVALASAKDKGLTTAQFDASQTFPFESNSLDFIYAGELVEHIFDTRLFLSECYRVLSPGGILVLTTPNLATWIDRIRFLFGGTPRQTNPFHEYLYLHIRPFTAQLLRQSLGKVGFEKTKIHTQGVEFLPSYFSKTLGKIFPDLGRSLISISWKK